MVQKLLPIILLLQLTAGLLYGAYFDTPTYDEPANMAASFDYVYRNDFRIYPDNPPLIKLLAGIALFPIKDKLHFPFDLDIYKNPKKFDLYEFGKEFVFRSGNNARQIYFLTRLPNVLVTIFLGVVLYSFASELFGKNAGFLALFLYSFDPNIRGHGHILAFDIPLALIILLVLFLTHKYLKNNQNIKKRILLLLFISILFSLGFLIKYTFAFFAFLFSLALIIFIKKKYISLREKFRAIIFIFLMSFITLWSFGLLTGYNRAKFNYQQVSSIKSAEKKYASCIKWKIIKSLPVPYYYKVGIQVMYIHNEISQPAFLLKEIRAKNNWFFYFPISFILKTPIPTQALIYLSFFLLLKSFFTEERQKIKNYFPFVLGLLFMFFMMVFSHINNVYRYLFPSLVLFILGASQIMEKSKIRDQKSKIHLEKQKEEKLAIVFPIWLQRGRLHFILLFVVCYLMLTSFFSFPYDLSYTNELTGIPPKGYKYLSDSEVDWGQDLERLANWLKKNNLIDEQITLSYLGTADPEYYGIKYKQLRFEDLKTLKGIVVISAGNLTLGDWMHTSTIDYKIGLTKAPLDILRAKEPMAIIGKSIFVYKF